MVVQLSILVGNVDALLDLGYTHAEVWMSSDDGLSYEEITASTAQAAVLESAAAATKFLLGGKLLKISVDGAAEVSILFSSVNAYWTPTQAANRINEVVPGLASVSGSKIVLTSPTTGRLSSIVITYSDALDLGWTGIGPEFGKEPRITLQSAVLSYLFSDLAGRGSFRYRWRFSAGGAAPISEFSKYVLGKTPPALAADKLSVATMYFVGLDGLPAKFKLIIAAVSDPMTITGKLMAGSLPYVVETDDQGFGQISLVRGAKVRVAIEGTNFVREFTVPNAATFDLLTVMAAAPDPYTIQAPPPFLVRRSI